MKYLNSLVFLGLMVFVAGCQKKEHQDKKNGQKGAQKAAHVKKQGPTKLETKKSAVKHDDKKVVAKKSEPKKAADVKKAEPKKAVDKKQVAKKDDKKSKDKAKN